MPATGRTRSETVSGSADIAADYATVNGFPASTFVFWQPTPHILYFDHDVTAFLDVEWQVGGPGSQTRVNLTLQRKSGSTTVIHGAWVGDTNIPHHLNLKEATGTLDFSEDFTLTEYDDDYSPPHAKRHVDAFTLNGSVSATVELRTNLNFLLATLTCTASGTMTYADAAGPGADLSQYEQHLRWDSVGYHHPTAASISWTGAGLACAYGSVACTSGIVDLAGTASAATASLTAAPYWQGNAPPSGGWNPNDFQFPSADVRANPSWAIQVDSDVRDYWNAAAAGTTIKHTYDDGAGHVYVDTFLSSTGLRIPAAGLQDSVYAAVRDARAPYGASGQASWTNSSAPAAEAVAVDQFAPFGFPAGATAQSWLNPHGGTTTFEIQDGWADTNGQYAMSRHFRFYAREHPERLKQVASPKYTQGTLLFDATHPFGMFETAAPWNVLADPGFLAANPAYSSAVTLSASGGVLSAQNLTAGKFALIHTWRVGEGASPAPLKPFGYRWYRLRIKADLAGARFRIGVGLQLFGGHTWAPQYAWQGATDPTPGTWSLVSFDLANPPAAAAVNPGTGALSYVGNGSVVHPDTWYPAGANLWLELQDQATYSIDYIEGFYPGGGATPVRLWWPLDGQGDSRSINADYDALPLSSLDTGVTVQMLRCAVNGARAFTESYDGSQLTGGYATSQDTFWQSLLGRLDDAANDTGIHVTPGTTGFNTYRLLDASDIMQELAASDPGIKPTPGTAMNLNGQIRSPSWGGYYGMGDVDGAFSATSVWRFHHVWGGEECGLIRNYDPAHAPTLELRDNDTGALLFTAGIDADGLYRLAWKYGVVLPRSSVIDQAEWSGSPPTYTTLGKLLNSYWLKPTGLNLPVDGSGYALGPAGFGAPPRLDLVILDRYPIWYDYLQRARFVGLALVQDYLGRLHVADVDAGNIRYQRADRAVPPFTATGYASTSGTDSEPAIEVWGDQVVVLFTRGAGGGYITTSDDDGATFKAEVLDMAGVTHPAIRKGTRGDLLRAYYDAGVVKGIYRSPAGVDSSVFTFKDGAGADIAVEDDVIAFDQADENGERWAIWWRLLGGTAPVLWVSADEGKSWQPA